MAPALQLLPAGLIDEIKTFHLSDGAQYRRAKAILEALIETDQPNPDGTQDIADMADKFRANLARLRHETPDVGLAIEALKQQIAERSEAVRATWSANHAIKANNYFLPPLEYTPIPATGLVESPGRDVF